MNTESKNKQLVIDDIISKTNGSPAYMDHHIRRKLAPFVLFDAGLVPMPSMLVDWHSHSGVATISLPFEGVIYHNDSTRLFSEIKQDNSTINKAINNEQAIHSGGAQWMASGNGIWHRERGESIDNKLGLIQSWLLLPPGEEKNQENGEPTYNDLQDTEINQITDKQGTTTKVLIGQFKLDNKVVKGNLTIRDDVNYFYVHIKQGQTWQFDIPEEFTRGLMYVTKGNVSLDKSEIDTEQLAIWYDSTAKVNITTKEDSEFVFAVAKPWPHKMVVNYGQVHSSKQNLEAGTKQINKIGAQLKSILK
ncbi:MAG: pirin family protein [Saccharospirillaceae bacterium]|nr:pirin family protein [Saccharospirillaceae bacterium]